MMKMKLKPLALLALAGAASGAALAQSSVTLYGRVNTTVERQKIGDETVTRMENNASRWGLRGSEDLGQGLKVNFILESGFSPDSGTGNLSGGGMSFNRQSELNLSSPQWGMLRLGSFFPESYFATADYVSLHNHDTGTSADAFYYDPVWFGGALGSSNKIAYRTPDIGGFSAEGAISLHEKNTAQRKHGYDLAANYKLGDLALGAGYSQVDDDKQLGLRALYRFGPYAVGGYFQRNDEEVRGTRNNFRIAGSYALGASEFHVNFGHVNEWSHIQDSDANQWTLGYNYNFSRRTKVYAYYTKVDNKEAANYGSGAAGADFQSLAFGLRHNF